jgi:DNA-binding transcriptional ArsR family regulator
MARSSSSVQQEKFHIRVMFTLLSSNSWEQLNNNAKVLYLYFMKRELVNQWKGNNKRNKDPWRPEISLSYREMEKHLNPHQFSRAIKELEGMGFIKKKQEGGLYRKRNWYTLSNEWKKRDLNMGMVN